MSFEWEELVDESTDHFTTHRAKIFGEWYSQYSIDAELIEDEE